MPAQRVRATPHQPGNLAEDLLQPVANDGDLEAGIVK